MSTQSLQGASLASGQAALSGSEWHIVSMLSAIHRLPLQHGSQTIQTLLCAHDIIITLQEICTGTGNGIWESTTHCAWLALCMGWFSLGWSMIPTGNVWYSEDTAKILAFVEGWPGGFEFWGIMRCPNREVHQGLPFGLCRGVAWWI